MLTTLTRIDYLPDPTLQVDNHYKPFDEVFGTGASEEHMPSLIITKYKKQYTNETSFTMHVLLNVLSAINLVLMLQKKIATMEISSKWSSNFLVGGRFNILQA